MSPLPHRLSAESISEQGGAEEMLRLLSSAVFQSKESILITNAQLELPGPSIVYVNPAFTRMTGYTANEVLGKTPRILQGLRTDKAVLSRLRRNLERGEAFEGEAINYRKDGTEFMLEWQIAPIRDSGGNITHFVTVYSQPGEGTTFNLYFPAIGGEVLDLEAHAMPIPLGKGERILIVDDEEPLVLLAQRILVQLGYVVETRTSVAEAVELVRAGPDRFDLVITDMTMPAMSGIDFAQLLTQIRPSLPVILTTGYPGSLKLEQVRAMGIRELLLKPPTIQSIGTMVHRVLVEGNPI